jgi:hypothetical protein
MSSDSIPSAKLQSEPQVRDDALPLGFDREGICKIAKLRKLPSVTVYLTPITAKSFSQQTGYD